MKHKHHIIPVYRCKELGIDPDFDENYVMVERLDHARIHWGYKCDDLEPLFEYVIPAQWIVDLIPRGDNRDVGAAVINARGEIDGIDMSGENHPQWKGGISLDYNAYMKVYQQTPAQVEYHAKYMATYWQSRENKDKANKRRRELYANSSEYRKYNIEKSRRYRAKKKAERQGEGPLEAFMDKD
tara:strand:- start:899 stop:1450 length:552 start_codon:yes stop_codon:yes gene_type:complete